MDALDRKTIVELARSTGWPAISIYLPTHRLSGQTGEDRIRFKNLVHVALERLITEGLRHADANELLAPLESMRANDAFWRMTGDGLAVFLSMSGVRSFRLGTAMPEQVIIGDRFYLRPLIAAHLRTDQPFYALALDLNGPRLFAGDRFSITQLDFAAAPTSEDGLDEFVLRLRSAVREVIGSGGDRPLVLLGIERVIAAFRHVSTFGRLAEAIVPGTTDYMTPAMVHDRVLAALAGYFDAQLEHDLTAIAEAEGGVLVSRDADRILEAASEGRVDTLYFDEGTGPFGVFDRYAVKAKMICEAEPRLLRETADTRSPDTGECGWDLIDLAVAETVLHHGDVHALAGTETPVHGAVALLRY